MNRRRFLQQALLAAGAAAVAPAQARLERRGAPKKVVVVGAGLAGLAAAYELTQAGHDVTILEARTRPGGRVYTMREPFSDGLYAEAGAMHIPDTHDLTLGYARRFDLQLDPFRTARGGSVSYIAGRRFVTGRGERIDWPVRLTPEERELGIGGMWDKYEPENIYDEIGDPASPDWSVEKLAKYDRVSYAGLLRARGASPAALKLMTHGWSNLWGDGLETVSALTVYRDFANQAGAGARYRIRGGNDLLPRAFASRLAEKIRYGAPVVRIERGARGVRAVYTQAGSRQSVAGDRLVCAIPFSVLRRVEVTPPFSPAKRRAVETLPYFSAARVSLQSRRKFWVEEGLDGFAHTDLPIGEVFDMTANQPGPRGVLQAYLGGPRARQAAAMTEAERVRFVLDHMEKVYPGIRENFEGGASQCWDEDPWSRGASSWYRPGQMGELWPHVATPEGRVHFAGDHTSPWIRWMQGALHSGNRVAREVNDAP